MARSVLSKESLKSFLADLAPTDGFILGLIIGQRSVQPARDFVIHLAPTPNFQAKTSDETDEVKVEVPVFKSLQDVSGSNVLIHAKQVTALLPGNVQVLGVFTVGSGEVGLLDSSQSPKLQSLVTSLFTQLSADNYLFGATSTPERLVMHFDNSTGKITSKCVSVGDSKWILSNADWKFQAQSIKWQEIESRYGFDIKLSVKESNKMSNLKIKLNDFLKDQAKVVQEAHCLLEGSLQKDDETLETLCGKIESDEKGDHDVIRLQAELLQNPCQDVAETVESFKCSGDLMVSGHVYSRIFMHPKATVEEAVKALKEDIIRSLHARFDLHTDALVEEEEGSPEERIIQHDLPRRIMIPLPHSGVRVSNYLYPGENAEDSMSSVQQLLGIEIDRDEVEEDLEHEVDPDLITSSLSSEEADLIISPQSVDTSQSSGSTLYALLAVSALFLALCLGFLMKGPMDDDELPTDHTFDGIKGQQQ